MGVSVQWVRVDWTWVRSLDGARAVCDAAWAPIDFDLGERRFVCRDPRVVLVPQSFLLGSWKAAFWTAERWNLLRPEVDPDLRARIDRWLENLLPGVGDAEDGVLVADLCSEHDALDAGLLVAMSPESALATARAGRAMLFELPVLAPRFRAQGLDAHPWVPDWESFAGYLTEAHAVVADAAEDHQGLLGLQT